MRLGDWADGVIRRQRPPGTGMKARNIQLLPAIKISQGYMLIRKLIRIFFSLEEIESPHEDKKHTAIQEATTDHAIAKPSAFVVALMFAFVWEILFVTVSNV
jgi:hypothetical protein